MQTSTTVNTRTDTIWLAVTGDIYLTTVDQLQTAIAQALDTGVGTLIIDLAEVTFLGAAGITALIKGRRAADLVDMNYRVVNPQPIVRRVLEVTGSFAYLTNTSAAELAIA